jgi:hypothetical protein
LQLRIEGINSSNASSSNSSKRPRIVCPISTITLFTFKKLKDLTS